MSVGRVCSVLCAVGTCAASAQVLTQFDAQGTLTWTNVADSNAQHSVEWAAEAGGPWYRTFQNQQSRDGHSNTAFTVDTPQFFRIVRITNPPPAGMVWIDGGEFAQGEAGLVMPVHTNVVSGFWMDATEVTKALWDEVYNWAITNGFEFDFVGFAEGPNHPIGSVSWYDAVKWCNARSVKEGLLAVYRVPDETVPFGDAWYMYQTNQMPLSNLWVNWTYNGYRLPTEAEWEIAARGGRQGRRFPWGGDTIQHAQANYRATNAISYDISPTLGPHPDSTAPAPFTLPVGSLPPNAFGLYDMAGNVREWCWDRDGPYPSVGSQDPLGPDTGSNRVNRGGSWASFASAVRVAVRYDNNDPTFIGQDVGFRTVRRP